MIDWQSIEFIDLTFKRMSSIISYTIESRRLVYEKQ